MRSASLIRRFVLVMGIVSFMAGPVWAATIMDHTTADIWQIPDTALLQAKATLHIAYGHTSHGSQIISGMGSSHGTQLDTFMANNGGTPGMYLWNSGGTGGALDLRDTPFVGAADLGNPDRYAWEVATRNYLADHADCNVIVWSWCGQAATTIENIDIYLNLMEGLIADYPGVYFVFMTGHLTGDGETGLLNLANEHIRNHCIAHDRILYDFADIESYDPDQLVNYMPLLCNDNCDYDSDGNGSRDRNWALDWQNAHVEGVDWWPSGAAHSQHLNGNLKGYAAWWLWATLGGWNECVEAPSDLTAEADVMAQEITLLWTDHSGDTNEDSFTIQRQVDGGAWDDAYDTVAADVTTYVDTGLALGSYSYRVVAHLDDDGSGNPCDSGPSNVATAQMTNPNLPDAPSDLTAVGDSQVGTASLAWTDNSNNEDQFIIQRRVDGGPWNDGYDTVAADGVTYLDDNQGGGPLPDGIYTYRVVASNMYGQSSPSNEASAVIAHSAPNAPTDLTSTLNGYDVALAWIDQSDNEESFILECSVDEGGFQEWVTLPADTETYVDESLAPEHTYTYRIMARNNYGDSEYSNETSEYVAGETFELVLKQSVDGYEGCSDAYLDVQYPTLNFGGDHYNNVENDPKCNFAISFDLPSELTGMMILEARIGCYCWTMSGWQENQYLSLYRITEEWTEGNADGSYEEGSASWLMRSGDVGGDIEWSTPGGTFDPVMLDSSLIPNAAYYPEFDIAALVQEWANGSLENFGVLLVNDSVTGTGIKASEYSEYGRPYLEITYTYASAVMPGGPGVPKPPGELSSTALQLTSYPNPANPNTALRFELPARQDSRLAIYSIDGRCVARLLDGFLSAGSHEIVWRGVDDAGGALGAGVYFARLRTGQSSQMIKVMLAR